MRRLGDDVAVAEAARWSGLGAGTPFAEAAVRPFPPLGRTPAALSARELDCLRLAAAGLTDVCAAQQLGLTRSTIRFHLHNACQKLGAANRSAAIYRAAKADYI